MFCKNCGKELSDDAKFCPDCGASQGNSVQVEQASVSKREESLKMMDKICEYFGKSDCFTKFDEIDKEIEEHKKDFKGSKTLFNIAFWVLIVRIVSNLVGLILNYKNLQANIICIVEFVILLILAIVLHVKFIKYLKLDLPVTKRQKEIYAKITSLKTEQDQLIEDFKKYYQDFGYCPLGIEYCHDMERLKSIRNMIRSGRAETIPEALNLIVEDNHKEEMQKHAEMEAYFSRVAAQNSEYAASQARKANKELKKIKNKLW